MSNIIKQRCCDSMDDLLKEGKVAIAYSRRGRAYYINLKSSSGYQAIYYCPWCGSKLPKILNDEYNSEISKVMNVNIEDMTLDTYNDPLLPSEFKTDEWWKKRGL